MASSCCLHRASLSPCCRAGQMPPLCVRMFPLGRDKSLCRAACKRAFCQQEVEGPTAPWLTQCVFLPLLYLSNTGSQHKYVPICPPARLSPHWARSHFSQALANVRTRSLPRIACTPLPVVSCSFPVAGREVFPDPARTGFSAS